MASDFLHEARIDYRWGDAYPSSPKGTAVVVGCETLSRGITALRQRAETAEARVAELEQQALWWVGNHSLPPQAEIPRLQALLVEADRTTVQARAEREAVVALCRGVQRVRDQFQAENATLRETLAFVLERAQLLTSCPQTMHPPLALRQWHARVYEHAEWIAAACRQVLGIEIGGVVEVEGGENG